MNTHQRVMALIRAIRGAFPDSTIVFTHGACYGLYQILKSIFQSAVPYGGKGHVVTKIGGRYYDINGEYLNVDGELREPVTKLSERQKEYWEACASGQRLEYMLKKYSE